MLLHLTRFSSLVLSSFFGVLFRENSKTLSAMFSWKHCSIVWSLRRRIKNCLISHHANETGLLLFWFRNLDILNTHFETSPQAEKNAFSSQISTYIKFLITAWKTTLSNHWRMSREIFPLLTIEIRFLFFVFHRMNLKQTAANVYLWN